MSESLVTAGFLLGMFGIGAWTFVRLAEAFEEADS